MKLYIFSNTQWQNYLLLQYSDLSEIVRKVTASLSTESLVISVYLLEKSKWCGGVANTREWLAKNNFISSHGRWKFSKDFPIPADLPYIYKLIRMQFGIQSLKYPLTQIDRYGWQLRFSSFQDHFAFLYAHEFHHYCRYHLGLFPREGEQSANKWAVKTVQALGFTVDGEKIVERRKKIRRHSLTGKFKFLDPYHKFRTLVPGDRVAIKFDPKGFYEGDIVPIVRPVRMNSKRIIIKTRDGNQWRWPMEWLTIV